MTDQRLQVSPQALAELEMAVRASVEARCQYLERQLLIALDRALRAEKLAADLQADVKRLECINAGVIGDSNAD
jgi:hypothetical protein